jgi:hypothetical protein
MKENARRPRIRIWMLMIVVIVTASSSAAFRLTEQSRRFVDRAEYHREVLSGSSPALGAARMEIAVEYHSLDGQRAAWHRAMLQKYDRAARYPWLSVAADAPKPPHSKAKFPGL